MTPPDMTPPVPTLEEMVELEAKATPGPWVSADNGQCCGDFITWVTFADANELLVRGYISGNNNYSSEDHGNTTRFIAASRAFVPWAIARIKQLEAEAAKWNRAWHEQRVTTGEAYWVGERVSAGELLERIFFLEKENGELKAELRDLLVDAPSVDAWNEGGDQ